MIPTLVAVLVFSNPALGAKARRGVVVMGTVLDVEVYASTREQAERLADGVITIVRHWDDVLSTWRSEAELERLNRHPGLWVFVSPDLHTAFTAMDSLFRATQGAFDPAVGALVANKHPLDGDRSPVPFSSALEVGSCRARIKPGIRLDSGAIGKGLALDAAVSWLRAAGARAAFLNFGGSSQTFFTRDQPVSVRIAVPRLGSSRSLGTVELRAASISSSQTPAEPEAGSIIDPATGTAVTIPRMATVCALYAADADAWSTALVVLGVAGITVAEARGVRAILQEGSRWFATAPWQTTRGRSGEQDEPPRCSFQLNEEKEVFAHDRVLLPSDN